MKFGILVEVNFCRSFGLMIVTPLVNSIFKRFGNCVNELCESVATLGIASSFKYFVWRRFTKGFIRIYIPEIKGNISIQGCTSDYGSVRSVFVKKEYDKVLNIIKTASLIVDAGSHIGASSRFFAFYYPEADIVSIEPSDRNYSITAKNTHGIQNIRLINGGLWYKQADLVVDDESVPSNAFQVSESAGLSDNKIMGISVDKILRDSGKNEIDIFKIDIEGAEKELFSNNVGWLKKVKLLCIELHETKKPGCGRAFFQASLMENFHYLVFSEYIMIIRDDVYKAVS